MVPKMPYHGNLEGRGFIGPSPNQTRDSVLLDRSLAILHRMATEHTGWRRWLWRWYYSDEPLRNDAANLVREAGFGMPMPVYTQLVGDDQPR